MSCPVRFVICTYNLWNVERWPQRQEPLRQFLEHHVPDVLCVQELRPDTCRFIDGVLASGRGLRGGVDWREARTMLARRIDGWEPHEATSLPARMMQPARQMRAISP